MLILEFCSGCPRHVPEQNWVHVYSNISPVLYSALNKFYLSFLIVVLMLIYTWEHKFGILYYLAKGTILFCKLRDNLVNLLHYLHIVEKNCIVL